MKPVGKNERQTTKVGYDVYVACCDWVRTVIIIIVKVVGFVLSTAVGGCFYFNNKR